MPPIARQRITVSVPSHFDPRTTEVNSGARMAKPVKVGNAIAAMTWLTRLSAAIIRAGSSCIRENAGNMTCWIGPATRLNGM